ncbi:hypothetical protein BH23THE1_BH23THE1_08730 [soil metagenome]
MGIEEIQVNKSYKKFELSGFDHGSEEDMLLKVAEKIVKVDPIPSYHTKIIEEGPKYYIILYIQSELTKKPVIPGCYPPFIRICLPILDFCI